MKIPNGYLLSLARRLSITIFVERDHDDLIVRGDNVRLRIPYKILVEANDAAEIAALIESGVRVARTYGSPPISKEHR